MKRRGLLKKLAWGGCVAGGVAAVGTEAYLLLNRRPMEDLYGPYPQRSALRLPKLLNAKAEKPKR